MEGVRSKELKFLISRAPAMALEIVAVMNGKSEEIGLQVWERKVIQDIVRDVFPELNRAKPDEHGRMTPASWGEMLGSAAACLTAVQSAEEQAPLGTPENDDIQPLIATTGEATEKVLSQLAGALPLILNSLTALPSLKSHREFVAGYSRGLDSIFQDDGITFKRESEAQFLRFIFWTHREELRPMAGVTLTHVQRWVNDLCARPINLSNVRKVAHDIGLKLADTGHPRG